MGRIVVDLLKARMARKIDGISMRTAGEPRALLWEALSALERKAYAKIDREGNLSRRHAQQGHLRNKVCVKMLSRTYSRWEHIHHRMFGKFTSFLQKVVKPSKKATY